MSVVSEQNFTECRFHSGQYLQGKDGGRIVKKNYLQYMDSPTFKIDYLIIINASRWRRNHTADVAILIQKSSATGSSTIPIYP